MTGRLLLAAALCAVAAGQMPGKKEKVLPVMADVKHIDCAVCGEVAKVVHRAVSAMRKELAAGKKLKEEAIIDKLETVCDPEDELGDWITHFDIVQEDEKLLLKDMGATGDCHRECRTIARACDNVFNDHDTDIAEALYKEEHMKRAELQQLLCYDLQRVCPEKKTAIKGSRPHDEVWAEVDPEKLKIQKMMKEMEAAGAPGMSMYSRDEMMQQMEAYQDDYEADADYAPPDSIRDEDLPDSDDYDGGEGTMRALVTAHCMHLHLIFALAACVLGPGTVWGPGKGLRQRAAWIYVGMEEGWRGHAGKASGGVTAG